MRSPFLPEMRAQSSGFVVLGRSSFSLKFVQALAERGYILATGKRPYVLVDLYGNRVAGGF